MTSSNHIALRHPSGASAALDQLGARLLSWVPAAASEQLYVRAAGPATIAPRACTAACR